MNQELCSCDAEVRERTDVALPEHFVILECKDCGYWAEYDTELEEFH